MKNIIAFAVALIVFASCAKTVTNPNDTIVNQGLSPVQIDGITLEVGERIIIPHKETYLIICGDGCKVNINGFLYYQTGEYVNEITNQY